MRSITTAIQMREHLLSQRPLTDDRMPEAAVDHTAADHISSICHENISFHTALYDLLCMHDRHCVQAAFNTVSRTRLELWLSSSEGEQGHNGGEEQNLAHHFVARVSLKFD